MVSNHKIINKELKDNTQKLTQKIKAVSREKGDTDEYTVREVNKKQRKFKLETRGYYRFQENSKKINKIRQLQK